MNWVIENEDRKTALFDNKKRAIEREMKAAYGPGTPGAALARILPVLIDKLIPQGKVPQVA